MIICILRSFLSELLFTNTLVLLDRLGRNRGGRFGGVCGLNAGRRGGDRAPRFAARHAQRYGATGQQSKNDGLNDFVQLLVVHRFLNKWVLYGFVPAGACG